MLRNLRSRRRPRYGGFLCAVVSALLILLSLCLLLLLRSHSLRRFPSHELNYDTLLSDSTNDDATGGEDIIDALDIVDEQTSQESSTDAEDDDDPTDENNNRASGYFFHHVEGVIRRSFRKRTTVENWDDVIGIFDSDEEDRGKTAFGSDDVAVDERVRTMAMRMKGIEDVLLLKVGKRFSPLREGWGEWFDKKSDFLRKDKMLRSNLESLNPLHNPMLQDPDSVGLTGLTKGDKLVHKYLMNELKSIPFPSNRKMMNREPKLS